MFDIKVAIVLEGYPESKLTPEQGEVIEDAITDELCSVLLMHERINEFIL